MRATSSPYLTAKELYSAIAAVEATMNTMTLNSSKIIGIILIGAAIIIPQEQNSAFGHVCH